MPRQKGVYQKRHRRVPLTFDKASEIDWARLAVLIDGEGTIGLNRCARKDSKSGYSIRAVLEVTNTDPRMMKWLIDTFGGRVTCKHGGRLRNFICFRWQVSHTNAYAALKRCLPYFLIKGDQAETLIAFQETVLENRGRTGNPPEVLELQEGLRQRLRRQKTENLWPVSLITEVTDAHELLN
jgi:hypothetical protein